MAPRAVSNRELLRSLRARLSGDLERSISQQKLSTLLGIAASTVAAWEAQGVAKSPSRKARQQLDRLDVCLELLGSMVPPDEVCAFFDEPHPMLLYMRPINLLEREEGYAAVVRVLEQARAGSFA